MSDCAIPWMGWQELLVLTPVFGGLVAGVVLLIVGLAQGRRGLWVAGLVVVLVVLLIVLVVVAGMVVWLRAGRSAARVPPAPPPASAPSGGYTSTTYTSERPSRAAVKETYFPAGSVRGCGWAYCPGRQRQSVPWTQIGSRWASVPSRSR